MQRSPKSSFGGALRDIQKKWLRGRLYFSLCCDEVVQRGITHCRERDMMSFSYNSKIRLTSCTMKGREVTKNKAHLQESFDTMSFIPLVVVNLHFLR